MKSKNFFSFIFLSLCSLASLVGQNIGIGTTTPLHRLHVEGNTRSNNLISENGLRLYRGSGVSFNGMPLLKYYNTNKVIALRSTFHITDGGNVAIGSLYFTNTFKVNDTMYTTGTAIVPSITTYSSSNPFQDLYKYENQKLGLIDSTLTINESNQVIIGKNQVDDKVTVKNNLFVPKGIKVGSDAKIKKVVKSSITYNVPKISGHGYHFHTFYVQGAEIGGAAFVSPSQNLPTFVSISQVYVSEPNKVRIKFINEAGGNQNPSSMNFFITVVH